jgi:hypothetical protein
MYYVAIVPCVRVLRGSSAVEGGTIVQPTLLTHHARWRADSTSRAAFLFLRRENNMDDTNTWPDASRPGVPLNPERYGWHWLIDAFGVAVPIVWTPASGGAYVVKGLESGQAGTLAKTARYLGPVLTPAEVAAAVAAARHVARRVALEDAALIATDFAEVYRENEMVKRGQNLVLDLAKIAKLGRETSEAIATAIRALVKKPGNE